jgi:hypothetical protein
MKKPTNAATRYVGRIYGNLTVLERHDCPDGKHWRWRASCKCGGERLMHETDMGPTTKAKFCSKNCPFLSSYISKNRTSHGMSRHPAYAVWRSMTDRCKLPTHQAWHNYGARGITVCKRWADFTKFWEDMGATYVHGLDLDRENNNGNYTPKNCRWTTRRINTRNRRKSVYVESPWGRINLAEAVEKSGIGHTTLLYRLSRGITDSDLLFVKPNVKHKFTTSSVVVRGEGSSSEGKRKRR